jgi:hypothetical protein
VLTGPAKKMVWSSGTGSTGSGIMHLDIADGNLVIKDGACKVTWMAPLSEWRRCSCIVHLNACLPRRLWLLAEPVVLLHTACSSHR